MRIKLLPKTAQKPTIFLVSMEIMKATAPLFRSVSLAAALGLAISSASAADAVLRKVPAARAPKAAQGSSTTLGLLTQAPTAPRALYVSSGSDLKQANKIVDAEKSTAFTF